MKAIVVDSPGGPDRLRLREVPDPDAGSGKVVVSVDAAGVNFIDTYHRSGLYPLTTPFTPGQEGAGTVRTVGPDVDMLQSGDRVAWASIGGSYSEMAACPADKLVKIPDDIDSETAAGLLLQGCTAHYLATDTYPLGPGQTCLIHAGAGGVGLLLTQIAKLRGARVITTVGSTEKAQLSREFGADHAIVYTEEDFVEATDALIGARQLDVVYDGVGAATFEGGLKLLRPRGMMVTFGNASGPVPSISPLDLAANGSLFLTRPSLGAYIPTHTEFVRRCQDLFDWIRSGDLKVGEPTRFPLAEAADAHRALEGRRTTGKLLLIP